MKEDSSSPKKKDSSKWIQMMNIPFQMGIIIFIFTFIGVRLDERYGMTNSIFTICLSLFSVFIALYNVIRQVKNLNK